MGNPTKEFFAQLGARGHEPLLRRISGTLRIDATGEGRTEHWYVTIKKGEVGISQSAGPADCVVVADKQVLAGIASGEVNAVAAALRDVIHVEGNIGLILEFQRLFPSPQQPGDERREAGYARRQT
jgi:hypothetical protein